MATAPVAPFFVIQCYADVARLPRCLRRLRRHYPRSRVLVISDGDEDPKIPRICARYGIGFEMGERLYTHDRGGAAMHRMLARFLDGAEPVMMKLDPDTDVRGQVEFDATDFERPKVLGSLQEAGTGSATTLTVQGGCIVVNRLAAEMIVADGILLREEMGPPRYAWAVTAGQLNRARVRGLSSHDWTLGYSCKTLGIAIEPKSGVLSVWKPSLGAWLASRPHRGQRIVHPRMNLWSCLLHEAVARLKRRT